MPRQIRPRHFFAKVTGLKCLSVLIVEIIGFLLYVVLTIFASRQKNETVFSQKCVCFKSICRFRRWHQIKLIRFVLLAFFWSYLWTLFFFSRRNQTSHRFARSCSMYVSRVISPMRHSSSEILLPPPFIRHVENPLSVFSFSAERSSRSRMGARLPMP